MKTIVGYCRVSTDNQRDEGTIDLQRQALAEYAEAQGYKLVKIFEDDGVSGGLADRPGLAELFDYLEDGNTPIEAVLILKLDRLARDLYVQEHIILKLESLGVCLISTKEADLASSDPMRKAFRQFMGIVSELEKSFITMRLSAGRIAKIKNKKGYAGGGVALGYSAKEKELIINTEDADTVRYIFALRAGGASLRQIAAALTAEGRPTVRGGRWYAGTIKYILSNPLYRGMMTYKGIAAEREDLALLSA